MTSPRRTFVAAAALAVLALAPGTAFPKEDRPDEVDAPSKAKPGVTVLCKAPKGMRYFLRLPKKFDAKAGARLVVFLHGSNMNGLDYLRSFEAKNWCDDDILCCPNGEKDPQGKPSTDPFGQNDFSFGSAPLVADVTEEVQKAFKTTITYVGGHSQGGFLTYSVITNFPDLYRGAIPMAGDCWMQNEPNLWEDKPDVLKKQRDVAIAVIHGKADPVVNFSQGQHAYECFRAMGWQKLRLFAPEQLGHQFMLSPVDEALDWLDAVNGRNEKKSLDLAAKWAKDGEWGWAFATAKASKAGAPALVKGAEDAAAKALAALAPAMKGKSADWVPKWLEFWRVYGATSAAKSAVDKYLDARDKERAEAVKLWDVWRGQSRSGRKDAADETLRDVLGKTPHTYQAAFAWSWLQPQK